MMRTFTMGVCRLSGWSADGGQDVGPGGSRADGGTASSRMGGPGGRFGRPCSVLHHYRSGPRVPTVAMAMAARPVVAVILPRPARSEEHTSELQSRGQLVCRLLL